MVLNTLTRYIRSRSSDDALFEQILLTYFQWDVYNIPNLVSFIKTMERERRYIQMKWLYEADPRVKKIRRLKSKYRGDQYKANKKDIQKISINKALNK